MKKILVTGGLGFVGSNLVDRLVDLGHDVFVIDNLSSLSATVENKNKNATYYIDDICNIDLTCSDHVFDVIFHLAAQARIQPSFDNPVKWFQSNAMGTVYVLEFARKTKCKSFVYATTSSKNHDKGALLTPYTFSKVVGEDACKLYADVYGMNIGMATFYNVYGPREPYKGEFATVVAKFGRQYRDGEMLTVVGDGSQKRDFTHVDDICNGMIKISEGMWNAHNFDLGRGAPISILDVAKTYVGDDLSRISYVPLRKNEGMHTEAQWKKTEAILKWRASNNLIEYIENIKL